MTALVSLKLRRLPGALAGAIGLVATLAGLPSTAQAQDKQVVLKLTSNAPPTSPWAVQINRLAAKVAEESKGSIKIEPYFGGQLGNEQDTIQQLARGRIDMGLFAIGAVSLIVPELQLAILPTYYASVAESDCMLDKHLYKPFDELLAPKGVKLLALAEVGAIDLFGKKPYMTPADVKGIKAISYGKVQSIMWATLGANSTFIGVPEWSSSLQTGVVDVAGGPMALYVPSGINKIAPVLSRLHLWNTPGLTVINKGVYDKLSAEQRAAFDRALAVENAGLLRREIRGMESKLREAHVAGGGQVAEPSADQRASWRKAVSPAWPEMVKSMGGQAEALFKTIEQSREGCK